MVLAAVDTKIMGPLGRDGISIQKTTETKERGPVDGENASAGASLFLPTVAFPLGP